MKNGKGNPATMTSPFQVRGVHIPLRWKEGMKGLAVAALYERRFFSFERLGRRSMSAATIISHLQGVGVGPLN